MQKTIESESIRNLRGVLLQMVYDNQNEQKTAPSVVVLCGALERLGYGDISINQLIAVLQDLKERTYLDFTRNRDRRSGKVDLVGIAITPAGRDLVEGTHQDDAVGME